MSSKNSDRKQNIKVFTRVRPRNAQELRSHVVVECSGQKEVIVKDKGQTRNFCFDKVFGPESKQVDVYKAVVAPMISEVLQGYNCTVFAYGQTGTGKTFTMVGDRTKDLKGGWENDPLCGIVPRTLDHLFDELRARADEYTVRVSFLELYNEELCDLLAPSDNDDSKTLRLYEDNVKKGSVIVSGLEERTVYEKNDVYPILEAGSLRRQTAPTLMNASSSRSHTIFTITVHVKVTTPEGEDHFKTGKLNLVDLAGSENIGRSGAVDIRAREAGNINQSLLTLGRVITSLVEHTPHIPYRESKLTRILQDSLGGRTKTSIIATVSPALCNLEETLSTFDYAHRARNIKNKPEINEKTSKKELIKNYTNEIEKLRRELGAAREKNGVYLVPEDYNNILCQVENYRAEVNNKYQLLKAHEDEKAKLEGIMTNLEKNLRETQDELNMKTVMLQELNLQSQSLLKTADESIADNSKLHDRLDRSRMVHAQNEQLVERFKSRFLNKLEAMKAGTQSFQSRGWALISELATKGTERTAGCRDHEHQLDNMIDEFLINVYKLIPDLSTLPLTQIDKTKTALEHTVAEMKEVDSALEELTNLQISKSALSAEHEPEWARLSQQLDTDLSKQKQLGDGLSDAQSRVQDSKVSFVEMSDNCATMCKKMEEELAALKEEERSLHVQFKIIRQQRFEEENKILSSLEELEERQKALMTRLEETREQATAAATSSATQKLNALLQQLSQLTSVNEQLIASGLNIGPNLLRLREQETKENEEDIRISNERLLRMRDTCTLVTECHSDEVSDLTAAWETSKNASSEFAASLTSFRQNFQNLAEEEERRLAECEDKTGTALKHLSGQISDFCEQTFASIHDRCNELKVNLKEEFLRDEKTGFTPQRKEFQYPKRLVTAGKLRDGQENVPPPSHNNSTNNSSVNLSNTD